jgi:hypothetical protein
MPRLWDRRWNLSAGLPGESGLSWGTASEPAPQIEFDVQLTSRSGLNKAVIKLYNLSDRSVGHLERPQTVVTLSAGYPDLIAQIFSGSIAERGATTEWTSGGDRITTIEAGEGELELQQTRIASSFAGKTSVIEVLEGIAGALNVGLYQPDQIPSLEYQSGWVFAGLARSALDSIARDLRVEWSIQGGQLLLIEPGATTTESAYLISPASGLIGPAKRVKQGVELTSLLLPGLRPSRRVTVESDALSGFFKPTEVQHQGSYRGDIWKSVVRAREVTR